MAPAASTSGFGFRSPDIALTLWHLRAVALGDTLRSALLRLIGNVAAAPDGWVWVQREVVGADIGPVDIFDATGEYVGTLPAETPWPVDFGNGDRILALEKDELDVQHVVVYRVRRLDRARTP